MIKGCLAVYPEVGIKSAKEVEWTGHYTRWVRLLDKHKDIEMDFVGLSDKDNFKFMSEYDFIHLYIIPKSSEDKWWWWDLPHEIRLYNMNKLFFQFDYEGFMKELPPFIRDTIHAYCDALMYHCPAVIKNWDLTLPHYHNIIYNPPSELRKFVMPLSLSKRDDSIGILWHAGTMCNITMSLLTARQLIDKPIKVFSSWQDMPKNILEEMVKKDLHISDSVQCFPFMEYKDYLHELRKCSVVLEDNYNYYGNSRLAYECSYLNVPVVGSTNSYNCVLAYPYTTTDPQNIQLQSQLLKRLYQDKRFYRKVISYANYSTERYYNDESCLNRYLYILRQHKLL